MGSEILLYGYGAICFSMIIFNIVYNMVLRGSEKRLGKTSQKLNDRIHRQVERIDRGEAVDLSYKKRLKRKLLRVKNMVAFDRALEKETATAPAESIGAYLKELEDLIEELAMVYLKRENLQAAFFAYFVSHHKIGQYGNGQKMEEILLNFLQKSSFYCKINALQALCSFGSPASIVYGLELETRNKTKIHEKVVTEILLSYKGDHEQLIQLFWKRLPVLAPRLQLAVLNYIRFQSGGWKSEMYEIMTDSRQDKELRLAAIRYFARYPDESARDFLLTATLSKDPMEWEAAAVSATALASYTGEEVIRTLVKAMSSSNWYIRYNAAASLEAHGLEYSQLLDIIRGDDRYAREMILYRLEEAAWDKEEKER